MSPKVVYHQKTEQKEDDNSGPENPLVLFSSSFDHANGVPADTEGVGDTIQLSLGAFQYFSLLPEIAQHGSSAI